tara:strand:+ start:569 stop:874 length:306 start_codon:yes stop_codon:yes gene_type:complete
MALYNPPTNVTDATQMISWINNTTDLWLFQGILGSVFVISLVVMLKNQANTASRAFAAASFITMILSVFARVLDLIPTWFMSIWIVFVGLSAIWMYVEGTK